MSGMPLNHAERLKDGHVICLWRVRKLTVPGERIIRELGIQANLIKKR